MEKLYFVLGVFFGILGYWLVGVVSRSRQSITPLDTYSLDVEESEEPSIQAENVLAKTSQDSINAIIVISKAYYLGISGFQSGNNRLLEEIEAEVADFNQRARDLKSNTYKVIQALHQDSFETGHFYVQIVDYLREMAHSIRYLIKPLREHLLSNHRPFAEEQFIELTEFGTQVSDFLNFALHIIKESRFEQLEELIQKRQTILSLLREQEIRQIKRIRRKETTSRNSILYFSFMSETKLLLLQTVNLLKSTRDFVSFTTS